MTDETVAGVKIEIIYKESKVNVAIDAIHAEVIYCLKPPVNSNKRPAYIISS